MTAISMSSQKAVLVNSAWVTIAMVLSRGMIILSGIVISHVFGSHAFGLFSYVLLTANSITNVAMLGMVNGLPRYVAMSTVDRSNAAVEKMMAAVSVAIVGHLVAIVIVAALPVSVLGLANLNDKLMVIGLIVAIGLGSVFSGACAGLEQYHRVAMGSLALGVVTVPGVVYAVVSGGPATMLLTYLVAAFVSAGVMAPPAMRYLADRLKVSKQVSRDCVLSVLRYSGQSLAATLMLNTGLWLAGRNLMGQNRPAEYFASFALGMQWFALAMLAANVVATAVIPRMTRNAYLRNSSDQAATLKIGIALAMTCALAVLACVVVGKDLILAVYGHELEGANNELLMFTGAAVFAAPIATLSNHMLAHGRFGSVLIATTVWWLFLICTAYWFRDSGPLAVITCVTISYAVYLGLLLVSSSRAQGKS